MVLFVAVFGLTCLLLDRLHVVMFASPRAFWLLLLVPWFWWMHMGGYSGLVGWRSVMALLVRLGVVGVFIMLLAQPRAVREHDAMSVVFALDSSMSVGKATTDEALQFVTKIAGGKKDDDQVGLVMFGQNAVVELPPSISVPLDEGISQTLQVDRNGTSLAKGLSLAAAVLPEDHQKSIVLVSDGVETDGALGDLPARLKARGIKVHVLPVNYDHEDEVWIERLELPRHVKADETYEAVVIVSSLREGSGELVLFENGREIKRLKDMKWRAGKNRVTFKIEMRRSGYYEYTASIVPGRDEKGAVRDGISDNNKAISYLYLQGKGKVLLVKDTAGDRRDWQNLRQTLVRIGREVEVADPFDVPSDALSLLPYDCILFVNVPRDNFIPPQFEAIRSAVFNQGSGFMMVGGEGSFGPGGYHRTKVEEILPVSMDVTQKKVLPKGALAIILHTCEFPDGNTWGKNITKQAMKVLGKEDEVGVLVFDWNGGERWLFELTPAREYQKLATKVNQAQIGDMPDFVTTMRLGLQGLKNSDASVKHMIIISDGDPQPPSPAMLKQFRDASITISTVTIFPHGGGGAPLTQVAPAMVSIAKVTGGNAYYPQDPALLPSIFIKEAKTLKKSMIQNKRFVPVRPENSLPSDVLKEINATPALHGYVITTLKPRANNLLAVPEAEEEDPLLSIWQHGAGRAAAFTSDFAPNWGREWLEWSQYEPFVKQLVIDISRVSKQGFLRVSSHAASGKGTVLVEDYAPETSFLDVTAKVDGPRRFSEQVRLKQVGPRRYEGTFPLNGQGRYQISVAGVGGGRDEQVHSGFVVPYSQEYLRFRSNPIVLEQITKQTGGKVLDMSAKVEEIFVEDRETTRSDRPIADWFLLALACLVPLDVGVRRVQVDFATVRGWLGIGRTHRPSDETFSQLLRAKRSVDKSLGRDAARPVEGQGDVIASTTDAEKAEPKAKKPEPAAPSAPAESTTARLLAARRQAQKQHDDDDA